VTRSHITLGALYLVALLPAMNLAVFGPLTIYLANADEFLVTHIGVLLINLPLALALALILTLPGLPMSSAVRRVYASILFVLGLLLWAQGSFFMHDYGVLDGRGIDWSAVPFPGWTDAAIWVAALALALFLAARISRIAAFGAAVFILIQSVPIAIELFEHKVDLEGQTSRPVAGAPEGIHDYSSGRNIVHVVVDNFQTDVFTEIVAEQELEEAFDGFVLYPQNTAVAPHTSLALPGIFSGRVYDGSTSANSYYRESMEHGFQNLLFDHGYTVNLMPLMEMDQGSYTHYYRLPKIFEGSDSDRKKKDISYLLDLSLFRQAPHWLRSWLYNQNNWRLSKQLATPDNVKAFVQREFFEQYTETIHVGRDQAAYHFIHLWPPHPPFSTLPSGRWAGKVLENTRENYLNEARPVTRLLIGLVDKLKAMGIYDQSLIVFQSDHGGGYEPDFMPTRMLGLLAVKPVGSRGPLRFSDAPTSVIDVAATILDAVGIERPTIPGQSVLDMSDDRRIRHFVFFGDRKDRALHQIIIDGTPYDPGSYSDAERIIMATESSLYRYGDMVNVGLIGAGERYLGSGWATPSDRHIWSNERVASLNLTVEPASTDLRLVVDLIPHVKAGILPRQRVDIMVNGRKALAWVGEQESKQRLETTIPANWVDSSEMNIRLVLPDAASPAELGTGGDQRLLGIALIGFQLRQLDSEQ